MSEENKTVELKEEELEKVTGGEKPCFTLSGTPYPVAVSAICSGCYSYSQCKNPNKK